MTIFTKILTSAKIGKIYGNVTIITERFKVLFDISDIGHSRVLSKSQLFSFSAPSRCVSYCWLPCATVIQHPLVCLWRSPLVAKRCGRESPGCNANILV